MKILLSNQKMVEYSGSEFLTIELIEELLKRGHEITLATFKTGYPILNILKADDIKIINLSELDKIEKISERYDVFWCHHVPTLYTVLYNTKIKFERIIYQSLSPFMYLETMPLFYKDISLILSNSEETKEKIIEETEDNDLKEKILVIPNTVPQNYFDETRKEYTLRKIAVVSNHVPEELYELGNIFKNKKIEIDYIGRENTVKAVNKEFFNEYSLIITIGKTVQYSFSTKTPVYCYDYFGGPGYINESNIKKAEKFNFSGRGFQKKTSEELYKDITENFKLNTSNIEFLYKYSKENYSLSKNTDTVLEKLKRQKKVDTEKLRKNKIIEKHNNYYLESFLNSEFHKKREEITDINFKFFFEENNRWEELEKFKLKKKYENKKLYMEVIFLEKIKTKKMLFQSLYGVTVKISEDYLEINKKNIKEYKSNFIKNIDNKKYYASLFPYYEIEFAVEEEIDVLNYEAKIEVFDVYDILNMFETEMNNAVEKEKLISYQKKEIEEHEKILKYNEELIKNQKEKLIKHEKILKYNEKLIKNQKEELIKHENILKYNESLIKIQHDKILHLEEYKRLKERTIICKIIDKLKK